MRLEPIEGAEYIMKKLDSINKLQEENQQLKKELEYTIGIVEHNRIINEHILKERELQIQISAREEEYRKLEELLNTILNFEFFKNECPLNLGFEKDTNEDKALDVFYEDEYCENACNDDYRKCWLKYFEKMEELERGVSDE